MSRKHDELIYAINEVRTSVDKLTGQFAAFAAAWQTAVTEAQNKPKPLPKPICLDHDCLVMLMLKPYGRYSVMHKDGDQACGSDIIFGDRVIAHEELQRYGWDALDRAGR